MDIDVANIDGSFFLRGSSDAEVSCSSKGERPEIANDTEFQSVNSGRQNVKGIANKARIAIPVSKALPSVARKAEAIAGTWLPPASEAPQEVNKLFNALQVGVSGWGGVADRIACITYTPCQPSWRKGS